MRIHVAARNEESAVQFKINNPTLSGLVIHQGCASLFILLQELIDGEDDYALFIHDDVFTPMESVRHVNQLIEELNEKWPNWGICGNAGILVPNLGKSSRACRYLMDPHGSPNFGGHILPAETIDGNSILLNCRSLRESCVKLPQFSGFQFYDICLSIETIGAGLAVLVAPQLACFHDSKGNQSDFNRAFSSTEINKYFRKRINNDYLHTLNGILPLRNLEQIKESVDVSVEALKNACVGRKKSRIAFIITSRSNDIIGLRRSIESSLEFAAASANEYVKTYVISDDSQKEKLDDIGLDVKFVQAYESGYLNILSILNMIDEDFVAFIDDGDIVLNNSSVYLSDILTCAPKTASLFARKKPTPIFNDRVSSLENNKDFVDEQFYFSASCGYELSNGVFYSKQVLLDLLNIWDSDLMFNHASSFSKLMGAYSKSIIFWHEEAAFAKLDQGLFNYTGDTQLVEWMQEKAELAHRICQSCDGDIQDLMEWFDGKVIQAENTPYIVGQDLAILTSFERKALVSARILKGAYLFLNRPRDMIVNLKLYGAAFKSDGIRGLARAIAGTRQLLD